jgi:RIO-like serine/threonine protein kinase
VHGKVTLEGELLILLHSHYPDYVAMQDIQATTKLRNSGSVGNKLRDLVGEKLVVGDTKKGYKLTRPGFDAAVRAIQEHTP